MAEKGEAGESPGGKRDSGDEDKLEDMTKEINDKWEKADNRSLLTEFAKLYKEGFSTKEEIIEMSKRIHGIGYKTSYYNQTINSLIWRKITPEVTEWCEIWREWYDDGVNRDQISSSVAEYVMSNKYKSPLSFKIHRVSIKLDMGVRVNRKKDYSDSYVLNELPSKKDTIDLIHSLRNVFKEGLELSKMYACVRYTPFELNLIKNISVLPI